MRSAAQIDGRRGQAIAWLRDSVQLLRRRIAWADDRIAREEDQQRRVALTAQRGRWQRHLVFLRDEDPKLAPIRKLPAFGAAFEK